MGRTNIKEDSLARKKVFIVSDIRRDEVRKDGIHSRTEGRAVSTVHGNVKRLQDDKRVT